MSKTLLIADSATDISFEQEEALGIKILNIPIAINGEPFRDRIDIDSGAFIENLDHYKELPKSSQITIYEYYEAYLEAVRAGYDEIITVCINGKGSGCFSAAGHAIEALVSENPAEAAKAKIYVVDSGSYTLAVAWLIPLAVEQLRAGIPAAEVAGWLQERYSNQETLIGLTNLKYPKLSGRLNSATAVVGDALGIKPVLSVYKGENTVADKCRGEKGIVQKMVELYKKNAADIQGDYTVGYGTDLKLGEDLAEALTEVSGHPPLSFSQIGPVIALNSGPRMIGMAFPRKPK